MRFWKTVQFEVSYQLRRKSTWFYFAVVLALSSRMATEVFLDNARNGGYFYNGPFNIAAITLIGGMIGLLVTAALAGDAATRDIGTGMEPLIYTTPISKASYLGGRFVAAFAVNTLLLAAIPLGLILSLWMPSLEPGIVDSFKAAPYISAFLYLTLPNAFLSTAFLFAMAALSRNSLSSYLGAVALFLGPMFSNEFVAKHLRQWELAKQMDPMGFSVMGELSRAWTPLEKSTRLLSFDGSLAMNRFLWLAIAVVVLIVTHALFRFAHHAAGSSRRSRKKEALRRASESDGAAIARAAAIAVPESRRSFDVASRIRQMWFIARRSFRQVVTSWGAVALGIVAVFLFTSGPELMEHLGVPIFPTTERIIFRLAAPGDLTGFLIAFLTALYAGELMWRERDARMSDIANVAPVPDWVPLLGKFTGLGLVILLVQATMMLGGILTQARLDYFRFEVDVYLQILFGLQLVDHLLFAVLAFAVHAIVNHKYTGHLVVIFSYGFMKFANELGIKHNLFIYGSDSGWSYSDMRGFGPNVTPVLWFKLLWIAVAVVLAIVARLLWVRGRESGIAARLHIARARLTRPAALSMAGAACVALCMAGFIFYNTNVLNAYVTENDRDVRRAKYERRHGRHRAVPQPYLTATKLRVELYPGDRVAAINGTYRLVNKEAISIDAIHLATSSAVVTDGITMDRPFTNGAMDLDLGHRIYKLTTPLAPGEALTLGFHVRLAPRGFTNNGVEDAVAKRATAVDQSWLPRIGYQRDRELSKAGDRARHALPPRPEITPLDDVAARSDVREAERINFEAIIGTEEDQLAVAPGTLRRQWSENGRRYFHYTTDAPIPDSYGIYSARYAVHEAQWTSPAGQKVEIEILHHPGHAWRVDSMAKSVIASLDYFTREFGPYPHRQIRVVEAPGSSVSLHADPINIRYYEGYAQLNPDDDWREIDFQFAVMAHEVAHQWWGNQVYPARVEGAAVLSESLAWFSAMNVVEETYGAEHLRRFMNVMRDSYLDPRARASKPLLRAMDWFHGYRKGPFAMYALREHVGEERVNLALRRLFEKFSAGKAPLPTTLDLYAELERVTPPSLHPLLVDLFKVNTFWELTTKNASAKRESDGKWRVTLDVKARKVEVDEASKEKVLPLNEMIEIGVFEMTDTGDLGKPLYLQKHRIQAGDQKITLLVEGEPQLAGIDPRNLLIDTKVSDNAIEVEKGS